MEKTNKAPLTIVAAAAFTITALILGYIALGIWPAFVFTFGYVGGFILWLYTPIRAPLRQIAVPFGLTLLFFVVHKIEEREMDFFPALSDITGVPVPDSSSVPAVLLYSIAMVWLVIPLLIWKRYAWGYYLAWTFFASMGFAELAHFIFPLFRNQPYGYFPGMWSVVFLAPCAWWGMLRLKTS